MALLQRNQDLQHAEFGLDTDDAERRRGLRARLATVGMSLKFRLLLAELVASKASASKTVKMKMILLHHIEILVEPPMPCCAAETAMSEMEVAGRAMRVAVPQAACLIL